MGRAPCCEKDGVKKGPWTPEEDQKLTDYIQKNGYGNWRTLPKNAGLQRCGKSCRLRWTNYLRPDIKRGRFSAEEDEAIVHLHSILGNKWSAIAARLPGRTDNEIKNYWNTHIRKRLLRMGIDPLTHAPRLHPSHHFNFAQINPDFITLANLMQIFPPSLPFQDVSIPTLASVQDQAQQLMQYDQNQLAEFGSTSQINDGSVYSCVTTEDYAAALPSYGSVEPETNSSTFQSNGSYSNNLCLQSAVVSNISTPTSSPTPLDSETMNYCSSLLKYGIPQEIMDAADFI